MTFLHPSNTQPRLPIATGAVAKPNRNAAEKSGSANGVMLRKRPAEMAPSYWCWESIRRAQRPKSAFLRGTGGERFRFLPQEEYRDQPEESITVWSRAEREESARAVTGARASVLAKAAVAEENWSLPGAVSVKGAERQQRIGRFVGKGICAEHGVSRALIVYASKKFFGCRCGSDGRRRIGNLWRASLREDLFYFPGDAGEELGHGVLRKVRCAGKVHVRNSQTVVHLERGLMPPDAEARFDFRRLPLPPEKAHKMIVLKGTLRDDGSVENIEMYQGVLPQMDEAARWRSVNGDSSPPCAMENP